MRKKLTAAMLAATMCLTPVSALASDLSAEDILAKSEEFQPSSTTIAMPMNVDLSIKMSMPIDAGDGTQTSMDFEIPIKMAGQYDVKTIQEPLQMSIIGDVKVSSISIMGQELMSDMEMNMQMYTIQSEDGSRMDTYALVDDGQSTPAWVHQQTDMSAVLGGLGADSLASLNGKTFEELLPDIDPQYEVAESDSTYDVTMKLPFSDLLPLIKKVAESEGSIPEDSMEMIESVLGGLIMNYVMGINKETYALDTVHMDFNGSDLSSLNDLIASVLVAGSAEGMSVELTLNDFSVDGTCTYNNVTEITVPADALAAEVVDTSEIESAMEDILEN